MADNSTFTTPNDYWKLGSYNSLTKEDMKRMLDDRGYYNKSITDKQELRRCLRRCDLGLLSYKNYTNDELRDLIRQRGIDTDDVISPGNKGQRCELVGILENEDINREFANFERLPAELRARVYGYYFADFKESLHAPKQAPITLVNSLLRKETLPLFYGTCTFDFNLLIPSNRMQGQRSLKMPEETLEWLYCTANENIADINQVKIRVCNEKGFRHQITRELRLDLQLYFFKTDGVLRMRLTYTSGLWPDVERLRKNVLRAIQAATNRSGVNHLTKEHFFAVRRAIEISATP